MTASWFLLFCCGLGALCLESSLLCEGDYSASIPFSLGLCLWGWYCIFSDSFSVADLGGVILSLTLTALIFLGASRFFLSSQ